ncbi:hypothetical protein [Sphingobium aromaticiconvertens]|uniref:hypothetical protein n=1 Tax=Sphingobium aromaticiconvertens TaxID=365341 RepID=UPI00301A807B
MKSHFKFSVIAVIISFIPSSAIPKKPNNKSIIDPISYANSVRSLNSCDGIVFSKQPLVADSLLMGLVRRDRTSGGKILGSDEFMTDAQNIERLHKLISNALGDSEMIVTRFSYKPFQVRYDANIGALRMWGVGSGGVNKSPLKRETAIRIGQEWITKGVRNGQNAYGAQAEVQDARVTQVGVAFEEASIAHTYKRGTPVESLTVPMAVDDARAFKASPSVVVIGKLKSPYFRQSSIFPEATIDNPLEGVITTMSFYIEPQCIALMAGNKIVGRLDR